MVSSSTNTLFDTSKRLAEDVYYSSICPRTDNEEAASRGQKLNLLIKKTCKEKNLKFIDNNSTMTYKDSSVDTHVLGRDGLHLTKEGGRRLAKNLSNFGLVNLKPVPVPERKKRGYMMKKRPEQKKTTAYGWSRKSQRVSQRPASSYNDYNKYYEQYGEGQNTQWYRGRGYADDYNVQEDQLWNGHTRYADDYSAREAPQTPQWIRPRAFRDDYSTGGSDYNQHQNRQVQCWSCWEYGHLARNCPH